MINNLKMINKRDIIIFLIDKSINFCKIII